jgi:hypothetical protein
MWTSGYVYSEASSSTVSLWIKLLSSPR